MAILPTNFSSKPLCISTYTHLWIFCTLLLATPHPTTATTSPVPASLSVFRQALVLDDGTHIQVQKFPGASRWALLNHLFTSSTVEIRCQPPASTSATSSLFPHPHPLRPHKDYSVYIGRSMQSIKDAYAHQDKAWCGWDHFIGNHKDECTVSISPIHDTYIAIAKPPRSSWFSSSSSATQNKKDMHMNIKQTQQGVGGEMPMSCDMKRIDEFSMPRFIATVMGIFFFTTAPQLSESTPFRLAGGSLSFALLSSAIVLVLLYRSLPHKRSLVLGSALFGSTVAATMRFIFGTWVPSLSQIIHNPLVLGYTGISALMGLALTYYYDDPSNRKLNTTLKVALQVLGMVLMGGGASSREGAFSVWAGVVGGRVVGMAVREGGWRAALKRVALAVRHDIQESIPDVAQRVVDGAGAGRRGRVHGGGMEEGEEEEYDKGGEERGRILPSTVTRRRRMSATTPAAADDDAVAVTPGTPSAHQPIVPPPQQQSTSPLVQRGLILNVDTGKTIQIGKVTYNKLTEKGYEVDLSAGTITPPSRRASGSGSASGGRSTTPVRKSSRRS